MLRKIDEITAKAVFDAAKDGRQSGAKSGSVCRRKNGTGIVIYFLYYRSGVFVIGGGVSKQVVILVDEIRKYYKGATFQCI